MQLKTSREIELQYGTVKTISQVVLDPEKSLKFVFRKGRKKSDYAVWETRIIRIIFLETSVSCVHTSMFCCVFIRYMSSFDYVHTDFEAAFRC